MLTIDDLRKTAETCVAEEPARLGSDGWWQPPLLAAAPVDSRFDQLPRIAAADHLRPTDLLPSARSVVVFYIPFKPQLVEENKPGQRPCRNWGLAYVQTNELIGRVSLALKDLLAAAGFRSGLTPATHNFDPVRLMARWSHKHLAYLVNLGRFGVHHLLITPAGCTGRLGSLVTEAELGEHPLMDTAEACLLKAGMQCGQCIEACPVDALSADDFDRTRCWQRLNENYRVLDCFADLPPSTDVCGKCTALMPCSFKNPVDQL